MNEAKHDGGPAFPCLFRNDSDLNITAPDGQAVHPGGEVALQGMTLRDYFASDALPVAFAQVGPNKQGWNGVASVAYAIADAMLKARQQ